MTAVQGLCPVCGGYARRTGDRLDSHAHLRTGNPCRGRNPKPENDPADYTVGYDSDPWVFGGGAWERNRRKF